MVTERELEIEFLKGINRELTPKELNFIRWMVENQKQVGTSTNSHKAEQ
ncbi:hypothetical protein JOD43_001937 [Pullulanibacillus pueri]|uniref:Uncharacterized protein n=1 Tax=Pullulanibacillus pueri TaxID=1437324 RepID=A0A8J2ZXP8_9BACL|nr:hypothetical protein [Pullulanibacillus pueri]MBM7681765.1 hypothetical protein [Pullulanibacillus pueri]GGH84176.1 hypothetical protein GCM10007096_26650 [Pullulanibacillus pueri]